MAEHHEINECIEELQQAKYDGELDLGRALLRKVESGVVDAFTYRLGHGWIRRSL